MPLSVFDYKRSVGEFEHRTKNYIPDYRIQKKLNNIARYHETHLPQASGWVSTLLLTGILSNLSCGRNSSEKTEYTTPDQKAYAENTAVAPMLKNVTRLSSDQYEPMQNIFVPRLLSHTTVSFPEKLSVTHDDKLSFLQTMQYAKTVFLARIDSLLTLANWYDPLIFPAATASVPELPNTRGEPFAMVSPASDDITIKKLDFSCIEERQELSVADLLTKVADALENPIEEMARELQVVMHYLSGGVCPSKESIESILNFTIDTDAILTQLMYFIPQFSSVIIAQKVVSPTLRMIAKSMQGQDISKVEIETINEQVLSLARNLIDMYPKHENGSPNLEQSTLPENLTVKDGNLYAEIYDKQWLLTYQDKQWYGSYESLTRAVSYNENDAAWQFYDDGLMNGYKQEDDPFFTICPLRERRGANLDSFCVAIINDDASISERSEPTSFSDVSLSDHGTPGTGIFSTSDYQELLNELDIGLPKTSPRLTAMQFSDNWVIYRVRTSDDIRSTFFHAIEMNGKLVPIRTKKIHDFHLNCEVYDLKYKKIGYPVEFYRGRWRFEGPTSRHVSSHLQQLIKTEMFAKGIMGKDLSMPGFNGLKWSSDGRSFLKIDHRFIEVNVDGVTPYIRSQQGERFYLSYEGEQFHFVNALCAEGKYSVNANQLKMDRQMFSAKGLKIRLGKSLNECWSVRYVHIKCRDFNDSNSVGSKIDVSFKLEYTPNDELGFVDEPRLRWVETIKCVDNDKIWQFNTNMYRHNQNSQTFFPWRYRYVEAYRYTKVRNKKAFHGMTRLYDKDLLPLDHDALPFSATIEDQIRAVKNYLHAQGGIMEVMITDIPQVKLSQPAINKERIVNFDLGFEETSLVEFSQGVVLTDKNTYNVFVTTSKDIRIAQGAVNSEPPLHVSRRREPRRRAR